MLTGPASLDWEGAEWGEGVDLGGGRIIVKKAPVIVTAGLLALLIVAWTVSVPSSSASLVTATGSVPVVAPLALLIVAATVSVPSSNASLSTVTVSVPVVAPLATLIAATPPNAVKSEPLVAVPPLLVTSKVIGAPVLLVELSVTV